MSKQQIELFFVSFYISEYQIEEWYGEAKTMNEMKDEQKVKTLQFGLEYLNFNGSSFGPADFKMPKFNEPKPEKWPEFINFIGSDNFTLQNLDLSKSSINKENIELITYSIGQNPFRGAAQNTIKILNLQNNNLTIDGAKILAIGLKANKTIEYLDLSHNQLKACGGQRIAQALHENSCLRGLNLYKNTLDVDGTCAIRDLLKVNPSIEFLDIGHNRIRNKGLEAIRDGIMARSDSKLKSLGLRSNFINDDGF